ncbi:MAG: hypothetical protein F9K13_03015 [Candidatus Methylomirabilis oxygeniifera]|uniref:Uncharacterized protein n=1 Tax=Methylomirabilis oxygeniifera TaxID=671143 RepID=D5MFD6_METO1|nr:MAG: hypothetical protein F9K13_03015 [Candidatus Methylomirabilis oxyfera]CBE68467.1 exported protein of unknown function [Candidatus Methylomirabilis oxyfera]
MKTFQIGTLAVLLIIGLCSAANAEYLIYLKGGHFIVADDCTLSNSQGGGNSPETGEQPIGVDERNSDIAKDCTRGTPKGRIFWSTINGNVGEVSLNDVYAIFGVKSLPALHPSSTTMPLEDYLITNRDDSFVNAKVVEERGVDVYGLKRDDLAKLDRRGIIEIAPERLAKGRSGEGLCPGEPLEFSVAEVQMIDGHLIGVVTNLSKTPWKPWIDVEVTAKGRRRGKFQIEDPVVHAPLPNVLAHGESTAIDQSVPVRLLKELERIKDADSGVRLCYRKIKTSAESSAQ